MSVTDAALRPGAHLYRGPDGAWRYHLPGEGFIRITAPDQLLRTVQPALHGMTDCTATVQDEDAGRFIAALRERGMLAAPPDATPPGEHIRPLRTILVVGDNPLGRTVAGLLAGEAEAVRCGPAEPSSVAVVDAVVCCAGWLPDVRWQRVDQWCSEHGTPWHMAYLEGTRWYLGPMAVPGRTAGYQDVRARRLAACGVPDELAAHWSYLDSERALPPVPWPGRAGLAVLAGLLVGDLLSYRDTGEAAADGVQLAVDLETGEVDRHPVLPLPVVAR